MTVERASEIVQAVNNSKGAIELFDFFVNYFNLRGKQQLSIFANMCGFPIAEEIRPTGLDS